MSVLRSDRTCGHEDTTNGILIHVRYSLGMGTPGRG